MINARIDGLSYPEFASDGSLYFHQWNIDSALMRLEVNNAVASSPFPVLSSHFSTRFPNYNKTRNKLAFVSNESGSMELWTAKKDGTSRKQLTNLNANIYNPVWSPDGDYIVLLPRILVVMRYTCMTLINKPVDYYLRALAIMVNRAGLQIVKAY